ncbi:hypothetical protein M406DRAFT_73527 [Cryphonectria parasitica EP155]|uniref:RlpA-like protein double-psi beta-barrel domain-containing protein n=1 Tax=Cryphonectria parasitica (strain ATCC 38755 / EP155) TaxID=660469 RepID=A0A9P4XU94_CRYP1|nr:uncharacterized protein M406DRAFT_73527 [Cryphonectria parasitica EP155]KAF3761083.1 hypothetical protein M406DRAFT_73527 [Cryphonectria parasitica EP155]
MSPSYLTAFLSAMLLAAPALVRASPLQSPPNPLLQRGSYSGQMTWIGPTTGAYTSCGAVYDDSSMYVAVDPSLLQCSGESGTSMTITCNGKTVQATAIDKCMGCASDHIDVATAVYEACGFSTSDGGSQTSGISWSF